MAKYMHINILFFLMVLQFCSSRDARSIELLAKCTQMAEPLVHDPVYVFPLTLPEIKDVCKMWEKFANCIRDYADIYLTKDQQKDFNSAIDPSMQSIQRLCAEDSEYQNEYLSSAPCMKKIFTERQYCGDQYNYLADLVEGSTAKDNLMCCAHHKFRECILEKAPKECDKILGSSSASSFVTSMIDRVLGFLLQQCKTYDFTASDCPGTNQDFGSSKHLASGSQHSIYGSQYPPSSPVTSTKFTWTTPSEDYRNNTEDPWSYIENSIDGPESQQFRSVNGESVASSTIYSTCPIVLFSWIVLFKLQ